MSQSGRSVARIDGEVVSNRELSERASGLVTVHWQHAAQALLDPKYHREFLDSGLDKSGKAALETYRTAFKSFNEATAEGLKHVDQIVSSLDYTPYDLHHYYAHNIDYSLDEKKKAALALFLTYISDNS